MNPGKYLLKFAKEAEYTSSSAVNTFADRYIVSDTGCKSVQTNNSTATGYMITTGVILDTVPFNYLYRVSLQLSGIPVVCSALQTTLGGKYVASGCTAYTAGTNVLVAYSPREGTGVIMGAIDVPLGKEEYSIKMDMSAVCRVKDEVTDKGVLLNASDKEASGCFNASRMKFEEHTDVPEWGISYITGMRWFANPYLSLIAVSDYTGVSMFECDDLLRLSGLNMQFRTAGREEEYLNDEGEYIEYVGSSLYPWEHFGCYTKPSSYIMEEEDVKKWHNEGATTNFYEPVEKDLRPFHRVMQFGGWLGQGDFVQVIAPPKDTQFAKFAENTATNCVARMHTDVTGNIYMASAKGISITKSGVMPAPIRIHRPDEISKSVGDNKENYKRDELKLPKDFEASYGDKSIQNALGIMDYSGFNKNWRDLFAFAYHTDDYYLPEEQELGMSIHVPNYGDLANNLVIQDSSEDKYTLDIDEERKEVEYTGNEAGIHLLPDGGIVIYDGAGSEIRFVKGNLTISCAGDINIRPGRNANVWAGNDLIMRAKNSAALSTTNKSIRIKAEKNLELLGANSGDSKDGVIIESKSTGSYYNFEELGDAITTSGIVLKSPDSPVAAIGNMIYLRSGKDADTAGQGIILDSGLGKAAMYISAENIKEYIVSSHTINFTESGTGSVNATISFEKDKTYLLGELTTTAGAYIDGDLKVSGNVECCDTISSFGNSSGEINQMSEPTRDDAATKINDRSEIATSSKPEQMTKEYESTLTALVYSENMVGNDDTINNIGFSFRTDEQLELPGDFYVYEDLWQHMASNASKSVNEWEEKKVESTAGNTYPYPGKNAYESSLYITQKPVIANFSESCYINRDVSDHATEPSDKYANPKFGEQEYQSLNKYKVVK